MSDEDIMELVVKYLNQPSASLKLVIMSLLEKRLED
jgi:hypothetical protein